jgi:hypothetical protein
MEAEDILKSIKEHVVKELYHDITHMTSAVLYDHTHLETNSSFVICESTGAPHRYRPIFKITVEKIENLYE